MPNVETSTINELIDAATALKTTFETKDADITAAVANVTGDAAAIATARTNAENDATSIANSKTTVDGQAAAIATVIADAVSVNQYRNQFSGSGRFMSAAADLASSGLTAPFSSGDLVGYNGAVITEGGFYVTNTSTYGGSADALNQTTIDLLTAMGRAGDIYGTSFRIAEVTAGSGTVSVTDGQYQLLVRFGVDMSLQHHLASAAWLRLVSGTALVRNYNGLWVDGVEHTGNKTLSIADGWVHVSSLYTRALGYYTDFFPNIFSSDGSVIQIAAPVTVGANIQLPVHTQPLSSGN